MLASLKKFVPFLGSRNQICSDRSNQNERASGSESSECAAPSGPNKDNDKERESSTWQTISRSGLESLERENRLLSNDYRRVWSLGAFRSRREFIVHEDVTNGCERYKIPALSYKKNDSAPTDYHYVADYVESHGINIDRSHENSSYCACPSRATGNCCRDESCYCGTSDKYESIYDSKGRLNREYNFSAPQMIQECTPLCPCNKRACGNMVIQSGCRAKLVLFRTKSRGWGVRTLEQLRRGTFVGIYSGELISGEASLKRKDDTYLFNLSTTDICTKNTTRKDESGAPQEHQMQFVCDAKHFGNFTRFINHSCDPNVVGIRSFTKHRDPRFPYIAFFTNRDLAADTELTLNYGDNYWLIKCRRDKIFCLCKKAECRFSKRTFGTTQKQVEHQRQVAAAAEEERESEKEKDQRKTREASQN